MFVDGDDAPPVRNLRVQAGLDTLEMVKFRNTLRPGPILTETPEHQGSKNYGRATLKGLLARALSGCSNTKVILERVVRETGKSLGADRVDILLVEKLKPELRIEPVATFDVKGLGEVPLSRTLIAQVIETHEALLTSDAARDHRFNAAQSIVQHAIRSVMCVPVPFDGHAAAVLHISQSGRPDAFGKEQLDDACALALDLGLFLSGMRLYEARWEIVAEAMLHAASASRQGSTRSIEDARPVGAACRGIAMALGLSAEETCRAWLAGLLHGLLGDGSVAPLPGLEGMRPVLEAIAAQDERHDGSGSPRRLSGEEIPVLGRILLLAKELHRIAAEKRGEGKGNGIDAAVLEIRDGARSRFHPDTLEALLVAHRDGLLAERAPGSSLPGL
jgi:GAF domain-containing protein